MVSALGNLRLHPDPDDPDRTSDIITEPVVRVKSRAALVVVSVSVLVGLIGGSLAKLVLMKFRYTLARGEIRVRNLEGDQLKSAIGRHLANLSLSSVTVPSPKGYQSATLADLVQTGKLQLFASDDHTIAILAADRSAREAKGLIERIQASYAEWSDRAKAQQSKQAADEYQQKVFIREKLQELTAQASTEGKLDEAIVVLGSKLQGALDQVQTQNERLAQIQEYIARAEAQISRPTIDISADMLHEAAMADPMYAGEYRSLQLRHKQYVSALAKEFSDSEAALQMLQSQLRSLSQTVSKQLMLDLPAGPADDLTELKLAADLYIARLTDCEKRWSQFREKIFDLMKGVGRADYDGVPTLLSQLRQDLNERSGDLPKQLNDLFVRLQTGPKADAREPGSLSSVAVRNVASSAAQYDLEQVLGAWKKLVWQVNRVFPEANMQLNTLSRFCRSVAGRLAYRERKVHEELERQLVLAAQQESRTKLEKLQSDFRQVSNDLASLHRSLMTDQRKICELSGKWPAWQELNRQMDKLSLELERSTGDLAKEQADYWPEELTSTEVTTKIASRAGFLGTFENTTSVAAGLAMALAVYVLTIRQDKHSASKLKDY